MSERNTRTTTQTASARHDARRVSAQQPADRLAAGEAPPRWISIRTAAEYLSCDDKTVRRLISAGKLDAFRLGSRAIRLDRNQLDAMMRPIPSAKVV